MRSSYAPNNLSHSRPFLHMLSPLGRTHQGYMQANQSLVEENEDEDQDIEVGHLTHEAAASHHRHRLSHEALGTGHLRPNIRKEDKSYEQDSDEDEEPQNFMIEATRKPPSSAGAHSYKGKTRSQPLYSVSSHSVPQETAGPSGLPPPVSIPLRPSEVDVDTPQQHTVEQVSSPKPLRGLDAYERALWNWVNVYNLDAFLQEVYVYYEGKGIYSIALARGLNLL